MKTLKVAEGAYFVTPYSVQTLTRSYDPMTAKLFLGSVEGDAGTTEEAGETAEQEVEIN